MEKLFFYIQNNIFEGGEIIFHIQNKISLKVELPLRPQQPQQQHQRHQQWSPAVRK